MPTKQIDALDNAQALGWADTQITRDEAGVVLVGTAKVVAVEDAGTLAPGLSAATVRTSLGLGTADSPTFSKVDITRTLSDVAERQVYIRSNTGDQIFAVGENSAGVPICVIGSQYTSLSGYALSVDNGTSQVATFSRTGTYSIAMDFSSNVLSILFASDANATGLSLGGNGTLEQRNGLNAQAFHVYNTYTDASNYERGFMRWDANALRIGTEGAGTGAALKDVHLYGSNLFFYKNGTSPGNVYLSLISNEVRVSNIAILAIENRARIRVAGNAGSGEMFIYNNDRINKGPIVIGDSTTTLPSGADVATNNIVEIAKPLHLRDIPASDPGVSGAVWNDVGTLKISAG